MYKFLLLVALLPIVFGQTPFRQCPGGRPVPASLDIVGCTALPCTLTSGVPLVATASGITTPVSTATVGAYMNASLLGLDLGFEIPESLRDACAVGITGASCPLTAGQTFSYTLNYAITLPITGIIAQVAVGLISANGDDITCVEIDATIS